ncbi:carbohydrate kinase [Niabella sp. CC-SYL272]|uniref:FGGY-family carbohydrate kinase n=1 Tax=Niabella agricola TaxID=2891571 RepID=UPI001EFF0E27|nr:FGGY family carbohydrate kinase [Niabella agricola]MCF3108721.1 carbohydrate kinase [Niabella agricola]
MQTRIPVSVVFDIGKTNKKMLVFDEQYHVVKEELVVFKEIADDDGFPCEDLDALALWMLEHFQQLKASRVYQLKAVNFTTYGASLVYVDAAGKRVGYLYNYLKPYPAELWQAFADRRGGAAIFVLDTCSPFMGHLNAGMQLFWLKNSKPGLYADISKILHLPQYLSFLLTGKLVAEMTHIGSHSAMWNFRQHQYHTWIQEERLLDKLCPITPGDTAMMVQNELTGEWIAVGTGLHDSSAAMIPYLQTFTGPFMILSTGTWAISLNPFNQQLPDKTALANGGLSYLTCQGRPVRVSMLFLGNDHEQQVKRIADHFNISPDFYKSVTAEPSMLEAMGEVKGADGNAGSDLGATVPCKFRRRELNTFKTPEAAYYRLMMDLVLQQKASSQLVIADSPVKSIYVDGGFSKNELFMYLLAQEFSQQEVFAAAMNQGTALGAALVLHRYWNRLPVPPELFHLKQISSQKAGAGSAVII